MPTRVVVAEDEAIIRMDLRELLQEEGYEVVAECGRGDEAVELVREHRPDVALLDIKMPGMDGISAARAIAGERLAAVVLVSAFSQRELIEEASDAGVHGYVVKPFERHDLAPAIEVALARFRSEQQLVEAAEGEADRRVYDERRVVVELVPAPDARRLAARPHPLERRHVVAARLVEHPAAELRPLERRGGRVARPVAGRPVLLRQDVPRDHRRGEDVVPRRRRGALRRPLQRERRSIVKIPGRALVDPPGALDAVRGPV